MNSSLFGRDGGGFGGFGGRGPPPFNESSNPFADGGLFGNRPADNRPKPARRMERAHKPPEPSLYPRGPRRGYRPEINEPYVPAFSRAFGIPSGARRDNERDNADRAGGGLFSNASGSGIGSILGPPQSMRRRDEPKADAPLESLSRAGASFVNIMRSFDRIVNDESDNSNLDAPDRENDAIDIHAKELELARRQIERSIARSGRAGLSDENFLAG